MLQNKPDNRSLSRGKSLFIIHPNGSIIFIKQRRFASFKVHSVQKNMIPEPFRRIGNINLGVYKAYEYKQPVFRETRINKFQSRNVSTRLAFGFVRNFHFATRGNDCYEKIYHFRTSTRETKLKFFRLLLQKRL